MLNKKQIHVNLSAPNLVNLCIDAKNDGEIQGRMYHCFQESPVIFRSILEMILEMEKLFDRIHFPQASTQMRSFFDNREVQKIREERLEKIVSPQIVTDHRGKLGTFITSVCFRQKSTWQGTVFWTEAESTGDFSSILELIRLIDTGTSQIDRKMSL